MPIYEYSCPVCGVFEVMQGSSEKPLKKCPECEKNGKKNAVERVMSASAFHLKGAGWYKTDYSSSGKGGSEKSSTAASSASSTGSTSTPPASSDSGGGEKSGGETKNDSGSKEKTGGLKSVGSCGSGCGCN